MSVLTTSVVIGKWYNPNNTLHFRFLWLAQVVSLAEKVMIHISYVIVNDLLKTKDCDKDCDVFDVFIQLIYLFWPIFSRVFFAYVLNIKYIMHYNEIF